MQSALCTVIVCDCDIVSVELDFNRYQVRQLMVLTTRVTSTKGSYHLTPILQYVYVEHGALYAVSFLILLALRESRQISLLDEPIARLR